MVILEAMAAGVPVVASNVEGVPEIIEDGVNGFLVSPNDVAELSKKLLYAISNRALRVKVAEAARIKVMTEMDGAHQASAVLKIYRDVLLYKVL